MALNDALCRSAKPRAKTYKLSDANGLQFWVRPSGVRSWYFTYRWKGTQTGFTFGQYPEVGLAEARARRDDARKILRDGGDPRDHRPNSRSRRPGETTFGDLADDFLAKQRKEGRAEATLKKRAWHIAHAKKCFGKKSPQDVTPIEVLDAARVFERRGQYETANRFRATVAAIFRHGKATAICTQNPAVDLQGALVRRKAVPRAAITDEKRLGPLLRAIDSYSGAPVVLAALQLLPILFTRPGELRQARWSEFDWAAFVWTVPAGRTKMRRELSVPLPPQAIAILRRLKGQGDATDLVFPSPRKNRKPISDGTLNAALCSIGYTKEIVTPHGFRSTASTLLNESGLWRPDAIERQLGHADKNTIRAVYARGEYWDERVRMMAWWAKHLDSLKHRPCSI